MKKTLFLLVLFVSSISFSQVDDNWEEKSKKLPGWVITNNGEKIEGYLKRFLKIKSQRKVKFFKTLDSKPVVYGPKDLKAYKIADDYYESLPYEGFSGKKKVFLLRSVEGRITLFNYYDLVEDDKGREMSFSSGKNTEIVLDFDGHKIEQRVLAIKDGKERLKFGTTKFVFSFKKVMSKYVADYPELAKKIKKKEKGYRLLSLYKIIDEYNAHFAE